MEFIVVVIVGIVIVVLLIGILVFIKSKYKMLIYLWKDFVLL